MVLSLQSPFSGISYLLLATATFILMDSLDYIHAIPPKDNTNNDDDSNNKKQKKIAIIGGGIGGSFTAKYLTDYDQECNLHSITIFSPPPPSSSDSDSGSPNQIQRGRVASLRLNDDVVVELGASIIYEGNRLASEMMTSKFGPTDHDLTKVEPFSPGTRKEATGWDGRTLRGGMGVYDGHVADGDSERDDATKQSPWTVLTDRNTTQEESRSKMLRRYNLDLYRIVSATEAALTKFDLIYELLDSTSPDSFFDSPDVLWDRVGLAHEAHSCLEDYLDETGVDGRGVGKWRRGMAWWRRVLDWSGLLEQGLFRYEMFEAMNLVNNNKNNNQMTALAGLVNFAASKGPLFAIDGGNDQLIPHAIHQASTQRTQTCHPPTTDTDNTPTTTIIQNPNPIQTVVSRPLSEGEGLQLYTTGGVSVGTFDIVVLAAPLQFCGINFLVRGSLFDDEVMSNMPLNGLVDGDSEDANTHGHALAFTDGYLPESAKRRYTQVVTTVIRHGVLNGTYFNLGGDDDTIADRFPRSILFTERGRAQLGFTSLSQITPDPGVYKVFSPESLPLHRITCAFGRDAIVEHVEVWGGSRGGATPDFYGARGTSADSTSFLLYDGEHGIGVGGGGEDGGNGGDGEAGPALYYTNAMEAAVSAIEISAIGAKAVSKLVAKRLGLITVFEEDNHGEEL